MLAIFELDSTLIDADCASLWTRFLHQHLGRPPLDEVLADMRLLHAFHHGMLGWEQYQQLTIEPLQGISLSDGELLGHQFVERWLLPVLRPQAIGLLELHRQQRDTLVLLSASVEPWVNLLASQLEIEFSMGIELEVSRGCYTGRPLEQGNPQQQQLCRLRRRFADAAVQRQHAYGYCGSHADLPVLEWVTHPRATNPNTYLRNIARRRGWPILAI